MAGWGGQAYQKMTEQAVSALKDDPELQARWQLVGGMVLRVEGRAGSKTQGFFMFF